MGGGVALGYSHSAGYGAITPRQFDHNSESIRVDYLAFEPALNYASFSFTGDLGSSNYTLQLDDVYLAVSNPGNNASLTIITSDIDWTVNEIVTVKLFEGLVGVTVSDDATLSSLDFVLRNSAANDLFKFIRFPDASVRPYHHVVFGRGSCWRGCIAGFGLRGSGS